MTNPSSQKITPVYFANLDALRFLAAFCVFVFHFFRDINGFYPALKGNFLFDSVMVVANKGALGVSFFFVLSGFLITYLILQEKKQTGSFSLWKFLVRRTLRIWPLYFIIVGIGFVVFPMLIDGFETTHRLSFYLFFLANFDEIYNPVTDSVNFLSALWSVSVEEQFYLFWSLLLFPLLKIKNFKPEYLILALYFLSLLFTWMNRDNEKVIYFHTFSVCQDILTGAFIGLSLFNGRKWITVITQLSRWKIVIIYLTGIAIIIAKNKLFAGDLIVIERFVLSLFFGFTILEQSLGINSIFKIGKLKSLNYLGKISYGFYMYHLVVLFLVAHFIQQQGWTVYYLIPVYFFVSLLGIILISAFSYRFVESPILRLKPGRI